LNNTWSSIADPLVPGLPVSEVLGRLGQQRMGDLV
jgi:hypothetical protein